MKKRNSRKNLHNSSSRVKNNSFDLVDRISALPDSILGLIMSYLPTKNAVATAILSKRWKSVWMTIHNLDFCLDNRSNEMHKELRNEMLEDADMKFAQFVNRVLLLLDGELLNKFRLVWAPMFVPSQVSSWITTTITRNVRDLSVSVWVPCDPFSNEISVKLKHIVLDMPASVFNAYSLQCLELNGSIIVPVEIVVCLPSLESLKLVSVYFQSEEDFENLICGCPKLNYLLIDIEDEYITGYSEDLDDFTFIISSTSLRRLELCVKFPDVYSIRNLQLEASSLEYLKIVGPIFRVSVEGCLSSLVEADFRIRICGDEYTEDSYDLYIEAVRAFDRAQTILLSPEAMWALRNGTICLSTKFTRLTKLEVGTAFCHCRSLQELIQSSDSLQVLIISQEYTCSLWEEFYDRLDWTAPVEVLRCLSNSLKEVSFKGCDGFKDEIGMIGYILMYGSVLEMMKVTCKRYNESYSLERLDLLKQISRFPRKSPACILEFIETSKVEFIV